MSRHRPIALAMLWVVLVGAQEAEAQGVRSAGRDSVTIVPGESYAASALHRLFFGSDYRRSWTTPMRVEVLDLSSFAGGLTPTRRGGGMQTKSLRFRTGDGRNLQFRSVDKDPSAILPEELRETLANQVVQDQISSAHPVGALVVSPILEAVGVLHAQPRLVVLPDETRLGEFQAEFGGMLGIIEERPDENDSDLAAFHGAVDVVGTPRMIEGVEEGRELFDSRAFLTARLTDLFLGDWDRHSDQWRWARFGEDRGDSWKPIPRDRDQAFVRMDGFLLFIARQYYPQFIRFDEEYPSVLGLTWNGRDLDRRLLSELDWPVWDSVATVLEGQLTDTVIEAAVAQLPEELRALDGDNLRRRLAARRNGLREVARSFYGLLAEEVEIHATDLGEVADVHHISSSLLEVVVSAPETPFGRVEIFRRRFDRSDTKEIRLLLHGGSDSVRVHGSAAGISVRVVGGGGRDVFVDEAGDSHFYDTGDGSVFVRAAGTSVDTRDFESPPVTPSPLNRDWGSMVRTPILVRFSPDIGLMAGVSVERYDFGFRRVPWASSAKLRAAWGAAAGTYQVQGELRFNRENSRAYWNVNASASGLEILRFHGFGNETRLERLDRDYELEQHQYQAEPHLVLPFSDAVTFSVGPFVTFADTDRPPAWLEGEPLPYGMVDFGQIGLSAEIVADGRDRARTPTRGGMVRVKGKVVPSLWKVADPFGQVTAEATTFLSPPAPMEPTLAFRLGAKKLFGTYPFHEAAFLGDSETVRLGREQRFAGDAAAYANAELRIKLARATIVLPTDLGLFGLWDVGRVWLDGEDSTRWHAGVGGGLWLAPLKPENAFTLAVVRSDERTGLYIGAGFAF